MNQSYASQGLDQIRMKAAYKLIEKAADQKARKQWKQVVSGLGAEIQRCGLLQALAFAHRGPNKLLAGPMCEALRAHLVERKHLDGRMPKDGFLVEVRDLDRTNYMRITREIIAFSVWLKRAAEILALQDDAAEKRNA